jgi:AraC-like DNA-binding protein
MDFRPPTKIACTHSGSLLISIFLICNLSPSRLAHLFKETTGISIKYWHNNLRLKLAREQLLGTSDSISKVASNAGYSSQSQFTKSFKKAVGCSPSEFRKSIAE